MLQGILYGFLKLFDWSQFNKKIQLKSPEDDVEAIRSDFRVVSNDLWRVTDEFKKQYC